MMATAHIKELVSAGGTAVVLGYGGSGRASSVRLIAHGFTCRVADRTRPASLDASLTWGSDDDLSLLEGATLVVKSPGVRRTHPLVTAALAGGIPVVAEVELGWALTGADIVSITGSNGKSTTTALLAHLFTTSGRVARATGNIGEPMTSVAPEMDATGLLSVELSSFQLEDLIDYDTDGVILLNVTPDHLDRYDSFAAYRDTKLSLLDRVRRGGFRILNGDDPELEEACRRWKASDPRDTYMVSLSGEASSPGFRGATLEGSELVVVDSGRSVVGRVEELSIAGPHNVFNALAAATAACRLGLTPEQVRRGLRTFAALRHRLEPVVNVGTVHFVNDSKATNLDSLRQALRAFPAGEIVLIAGGRDKDSPFEDLADDVARAVRHLVLIGEAGDRIAAAWPGIASTRAGTDFEGAIRAAYQNARPRGVVLLSPGCASFDMFTGFAERGERFSDVAHRIACEEADHE
jgi:UDP-N-acetylmuramoylalanine--D-glutamate ligase